MNLSNEGDCIHGREFCIECHDKKTLRRPGSVGQAHRIIVQLQAEIARISRQHQHLWQWIPIGLRNQYAEDYPMNKPEDER